jgi:hypothetical protein
VEGVYSTPGPGPSSFLLYRLTSPASCCKFPISALGVLRICSILKLTTPLSPPSLPPPHHHLGANSAVGAQQQLVLQPV